MKKHIMVIDDEEGIRDVLSQVLTAEGFRVSTAKSGAEALRIAKSDPAQLIISDLQMEDTDGLELIEELKLILSDVPVILLTGVIFEPDVIMKTIQKKVSCYIDKTAPLNAILQEVHRLAGTPAAEVAA